MKLAFDPQVSYPEIMANHENRSDKNDQNTLKQLCQDFESIFINSLFKEMRKSIPDNGYLKHEMSMEIFHEMMDMEIARELSNRGGLGLARLIYEQLQYKKDAESE